METLKIFMGSCFFQLKSHMATFRFEELHTTIFMYQLLLEMILDITIINNVIFSIYKTFLTNQ